MSWFISEGRPAVQAENWTGAGYCHVCFAEHGRNKALKSRRAAIRHRLKKHRWLHDVLVSNGLADPA